MTDKERDGQSRSARPIIYFVLPCYNEAEGLRHTAEVLRAKVEGLVAAEQISERSRILFVDDGSKDGTWDIICDLHDANGLLFGGVKLAHNRGHQNALFAGLMVAKDQGCDAAISMDADLQDDVNTVDEFITNFRNGDEIVYGVRSARKKDTWFKRNTAEAFYKVFEWMGAETVPDHADYRLMSSEALDALSEYHEVNLFLRGIVPTLGYRTSKVYYERGERESRRIEVSVEENDRVRHSGHHFVLDETVGVRHECWRIVHFGGGCHVHLRDGVTCFRTCDCRMGLHDDFPVADRRSHHGFARHCR